MEVATRSGCIWVHALESLHEGELEVGLDNTRLKMRANRTNSQHHALVEPVMFRRHGDVQNRNGHSGIGDHEVEQLSKRSGRSFECCISQEVRVVRADGLQNDWASEDDSEMFSAVGLNISGCSLTDGLYFFEAIVRVQVRTELLGCAVATLVPTESSVLQCADDRVVPDLSADLVWKVLQHVVIHIVERFWRHVGAGFHEILGCEDLELFISNGTRMILLDSQLVG